MLVLFVFAGYFIFGENRALAARQKVFYKESTHKIFFDVESSAWQGSNERAFDTPIEAVWQWPPGAVKGLLVVAHGCSHSSTDFWPFDERTSAQKRLTHRSE